MIQKETSDYDIASYTDKFNNLYSTEYNSIKEKKRASSKYIKTKHLKINSEEIESRTKKGFPVISSNNSFHNNINLYLNKKNYIIKQKKKCEPKYFEKEQLFDKVLKLQKAFNILNQKYNKQKIENIRQSKEIQKHNRLLNTLNINNFKVKRCYSKPNMTNVNTKKNSLEKEDIKNIKDITDENGIENKQCNQNGKFSKKYINFLKDENELLKNDYDKIKIVNETLISNLKLKCITLEKENEIKNNEISEMKKSIKCTKFNELLKEKEIYEKEMKKMKKQLNDALKLINKYKIQEEEMKQLYEENKKKDFKIKALEIELLTLSNNLDEAVHKLENEIIMKDKIIKKQEREIKFKKFINNNEDNKIFKSLNIKINLNKNIEEIYIKHPELYQLYIEMKQKGMNSTKIYNNSILKKLEENKTMPDNKIVFIESIIDLFNIQDMQSKSLILDLANKEFVNNQNLSQIKSNQISILDTLLNNNNNKNKPLNDEDLKNILLLNKDNQTSKMFELFEKYDIDKKGFITFNEMKEIIEEVKFDNIKEDILLYTKSEIFNKMNYYKLLLLTESSNSNSNSLEENIEKLNNKLRIFADLIKSDNHDNNCPKNDYLSYIKDIIYAKKKDKGEKIEVINLENFVKFLNMKNIVFETRDKELLLQLYGLDSTLELQDNKNYQKYLDYNKINNKLSELTIYDENIKDNKKEDI